MTQEQKELNYNGSAQKRHRGLMEGINKKNLFKKLGILDDLGNYRNFLNGNRKSFPVEKQNMIEEYFNSNE